MLRLKVLIMFLLVGLCTVCAQTEPVVMTIGDETVSLNEFEHSYNKNKGSHLTVGEYANNFIDYKLKVLAAKDLRLDTLPSFKREFNFYRDALVSSMLINNDELEQEARKIYDDVQRNVDENGGMVRVAQIFVQMKQQTTNEAMRAAKVRIDSIYGLLQHGADFFTLAARYSDDKQSAQYGGLLPWIAYGHTLKEFEDVAFSLQKGEMSKPFETPAGWHIVLLKDKQNAFPYDSVRAEIVKNIEQRILREEMIGLNSDSSILLATGQYAEYETLEDKVKELEKANLDFKYLLKEFYDGLLTYRISNQMVVEKAVENDAGLNMYFNKNKKKYRWGTPRYKGIVYYAKSKSISNAVRKILKRTPLDKWKDVISLSFGEGSVQQVATTIGLFEMGDNPFVDREVFKKDIKIKVSADYPIVTVYGKKLKKPETLGDVRNDVLADYQKELENEWIKELREKYSVVVNKNVLTTVNIN